MGFRDRLNMFDLLAFLTASTRKVLLYVVGDDDGSYKPVTESMLAGGGSDPASARETTLGEVRDRLAGTLNVNTGNTDPATGARQTTANTTLADVRTSVGTLATQAGAEGLHIRPPVIATLAPQTLTVGSAAVGLPNLGAANAVTVHVISGSVRRSVGGTPAATTPGLTVGDSESLRDAELGAYRLIRDGSSDAVLWLEPRVVG